MRRAPELGGFFRGCRILNAQLVGASHRLRSEPISFASKPNCPKNASTPKRFPDRTDLGCAIRAIVLYGSTARGEANQSSDVDVLVVLADGETEGEHRDVIMQHAFEIGAIDHGVGIMPYIMPHEHYEERKESSFLRTVLAEGQLFRPESTGEDDT